MTEKKEEVSEIHGEFIICGKPRFREGRIYDYTGAWIKLSLIKHIEFFDEEKRDLCKFYTYKDEWYIAEIHPHDLVKEINNFYKINKRFSHD